MAGVPPGITETLDTLLDNIHVWLREIGRRIAETPPHMLTAYAMTALGAGMLIGGAILVLDDIDDLGFFSTPDHPSPLHHWIYGVLLIVFGAIILGIGLALLLREWLGGQGK